MKQVVLADIETLSKSAGDLLSEGHHCAEAVMQVVGEAVFPDYNPFWLKMTNGFCSKVGSPHENMCGAYIAGVMLLGAFQGRTSGHENDEKFLLMVQDFKNDFIQWNGTVNCQELLDKKNC